MVGAIVSHRNSAVFYLEQAFPDDMKPPCRQFVSQGSRVNTLEKAISKRVVDFEERANDAVRELFVREKLISADLCHDLRNLRSRF
jgi:hypothetical protein